jgi:tRNA modification GTPase
MHQHLAHDEQSIIALCTPHGAGALALIRLTGIDAVIIADRIAKLASNKKNSKKNLVDLPTHTIHYGTVIDAKGSAIDQVLFLLMRGPKTFTGHDTVEITCHNNPHIIETIINLALAAGARHAQPGEFTRRAVLNNKIDIIQAEAINELIAAQTLTATKQALSQVSGSLSAQLGEVERSLLKSLMLCEATFEFLDEENVSFDDSIQTEIDQALTILSRLEKSFEVQEILRQGVRVALIGSVNAGKSSLFNALLGRDRAIVTPIAGTTRDVIESTITRDGFQLTLVDTAGLRTTNDTIEQEGIRRSHQEAALADIVLLVRDGSQMLTEQEATLYKDLEENYAEKCITVATKADLPNLTKTLNTNTNVSNTTGLGITELEDLIQQKIAARMSTSEAPFLVTKRQQTLLSETKQRLDDASALLSNATVAHELISHHLRDTLALLGECTGKTISEQGMDAIFKTFCVGK